MPRRLWAVICLFPALACDCGGDPDPGPSGTAILQQIVSEGQLLQGTGADGRTGDYLFDNGVVRLVVQNPDSATGWGLYGGSLIDLDLVPSTDLERPGDDRLQEIFVQCDLRGFDPEQVEIVSDGSDGTAAVLRLTGTDRGIPLLDSVLPSSDLELTITADVVLPADSSTIELLVTARDDRKLEARDLACGVVALRGDELDLFVHGRGFELGGSTLPYLAAAATDAYTSWVLHAEDAELSVIAAVDEVVPLTGPRKPLLANGTYQQRFFISAGGGDHPGAGSIEAALSAMRRHTGDATERQRVRITTGATPALALARALFVDRDRPAGRGSVTATALGRGPAEVALPAGRYTMIVSRGGQEHSRQDFEVAGSEVELSVELPSPAAVIVEGRRLNASGQETGPIGSKLTLMRGHDAPPGGERVLEQYLLPRALIAIDPGEYTAYFSHGPEYELDVQNWTLPLPDGAPPIQARLRHVVDTTGWVSADLHVHSTRSADADERLETRVLGAIGEGLEILVSTDHDVVTDYQPIVKKFELQQFLRTEKGIEISPLYGHMNAWPMTDEPANHYWTVRWFEYDENAAFRRMIDPHEIVPLARSKGAEIVQVNHPRGSQAVFDYIGLNPETLESRRPLPDADAFELLNSKGGGNFEAGLQDLFGLIKNDRRMTATGVSDAHSRGSEVGYARTMIASASDDPASLDLPAIWQALKEGRALVISGPFLRVNASSGARRAGVGETLDSGGGPIALELQVQAPSWMSVDRLRVFENGEAILDRAITASDAAAQDPVIRLETVVTATPTVDSFYLVVVEGSGDNAPVIGARARSISNPVFVDVDGGGFRYSR